MSKKIILFFSICIIITSVIFSLLLQKHKDKISDSSTSVSSYQSQRDAAITEYLLSQEMFSWKTSPKSTNFCVFAVLNKETDLFPLTLWVRCGEYELKNEKLVELSGTSVPVLIEYPNELSFFDVKKFTHKTPRDGALYAQDMRSIFPEEFQQTLLTYDAQELNRTIEQVAKEKLVQQASEKQITVTGKVICLSHKNKTGPQTEECAFGLRDTDGKEYGLSDVEMKFVTTLPMNQEITIIGIVYDNPSTVYDAQQTIRIESVK